MIELNSNQLPVAGNLPGQAGSMRISGGAHVLIERLAETLPSSVVRTNALADQITVEDGYVSVTSQGAENITVRAAQIVLAVPPRIAATTINWIPSLPLPLSRALTELPTWMAPHAKALIQYEMPFWRSRGLSGRISSRVGPLAEVHDHSDHDEQHAVLFGFFGWPHDRRLSLGSELKAYIVKQLVRCLGIDARKPTAIHVKDWAQDPLVTAPSDLHGWGGHPRLGSETIRQPHYGGRVWFASAEAAAQSPGLIEGALVAAEHVAKAIDKSGIKKSATS